MNTLIKIKNAQDAKKENVKVPFSNFSLAILELLEKHKLVEAVSKKGRMPKRIIEIKLKYNNGEGAIHQIKFLSRPSRRLYMGYKDIRPIRQGYGVLILSTPKGVVDGKTARKEKVGGQALFEVW
ncbi:MAG: 30S ribosomal protein S8 [bacterium]|nr:30S ribosomal protein S8 [bacterium]